jgi:hypothetical protein
MLPKFARSGVAIMQHSIARPSWLTYPLSHGQWQRALPGVPGASNFGRTRGNRSFSPISGAAWRAISAELNRTHLAAQVALADGLNLDKVGQLHGGLPPLRPVVPGGR